MDSNSTSYKGAASVAVEVSASVVFLETGGRESPLEEEQRQQVQRHDRHQNLMAMTR